MDFTTVERKTVVESLKQNFALFTRLPPCLFSTTVILNNRSGILINQLSKNFSLHVIHSTEVESFLNYISLRVYQYQK
jgi:hypothetical protein